MEYQNLEIELVESRGPLGHSCSPVLICRVDGISITEGFLYNANLVLLNYDDSEQKWNEHKQELAPNQWQEIIKRLKEISLPGQEPQVEGFHGTAPYWIKASLKIKFEGRQFYLNFPAAEVIEGEDAGNVRKLFQYLFEIAGYRGSSLLIAERSDFLETGAKKEGVSISIPVPLEKCGETLYCTRLERYDLINEAEFYLAVAAPVSQQRQVDEIPRLTRISSGETIETVIEQELSGVSITFCPDLPGSIAPEENFLYFKLQTAGPSWEAIIDTRNLSIYIPETIPVSWVKLFAAVTLAKSVRSADLPKTEFDTQVVFFQADPDEDFDPPLLYYLIKNISPSRGLATILYREDFGQFWKYKSRIVTPAEYQKIDRFYREFQKFGDAQKIRAVRDLTRPPNSKLTFFPPYLASGHHRYRMSVNCGGPGIYGPAAPLLKEFMDSLFELAGVENFLPLTVLEQAPQTIVPLNAEKKGENLLVCRIDHFHEYAGAGRRQRLDFSVDDLRKINFYLGVKTEMTDSSLTDFVRHSIRISSADVIDIVVEKQLPGVIPKVVIDPAGAIRTVDGFRLFQLETDGSYWEGITGSRQIGVYCRDLSQLEINLFFEPMIIGGVGFVRQALDS